MAAAVALVVAASSCGSPAGRREGPAPTTTASTPAIAPGVTATSSWTTYQGGAGRLGDAPPEPGISAPAPAWSDSLDGAAVYGQPLVYRGDVVVATEEDDVYALDATTGRVVWHDHLGTPLRGVVAAAGCGDIDPLGVTSTPVIDPATGTLYVLAEIATSGHEPVSHRLFAIDAHSGRVVWSEPADPPLPPGEHPVNLLQRAALALGNDRVYIGYGGQYGDCGTYHGWLVAEPVSGGPSSAFDVTPTSTGGAIWGGGSGPSIGPDGSVFVTTGNPNSPGPSPWAEAVLELSPALATPPEAVFRDPRAYGDLDLSTGSALLLPGGRLLAAGKTDTAYLLERSDLARVAPVAGTVCGSDPDGGAAYDGSLDSVYVPCRAGGIQQIALSRRATGWKAGSANSTVVLAGGALWSVSYPQGVLQEIDPATGRVEYSRPVGRRTPTFASVTVVGGMVLVPTDSGVEAFRDR